MGIVWFVDVVNIIKWATAYSGYWAMALLVLLSTIMLPYIDSDDFGSFVDSSENEAENYKWLGWFTFTGYLLYAAFNTVIQLLFDECLGMWGNWARQKIQK